MSKGSWRRPFDRKKWDAGWGRAFGRTVCAACGRSIRLLDAVPIPGARGDVGVLCRDCRRKEQS